jgi:hypothetical protein
MAQAIDPQQRRVEHRYTGCAHQPAAWQQCCGCCSTQHVVRLSVQYLGSQCLGYAHLGISVQRTERAALHSRMAQMSDCHVPLALQADALSRRVEELHSAAAELKRAQSVVVVGGGEVGAVNESVQSQPE